MTSREGQRAAIAELVATFSFVFLGAGTVVSTGMIMDGGLTPARLTAIALAHGLAIAIMVASTARFSGGHINPAVTIAAVVMGKMSITRGTMYVLAQLVGGIAAAFLLKGIIPGNLEGGLGSHALGSVDSAGIGVLVEIVLTFFLVFVVFVTAMDPKGPGLPIAPFAIGLTVMVDHLVGVPLTGASMNPARSLGPAWAAGQWADHWVYWVGPIAGGIIAAVLFQGVFRKWAGQSEGDGG
ncbi:MAG: MIP family channel protein [Chloroflexi bacterium]|nr:MIP family channel protein [Chloroflexota bacterium]